LQKKKQATEIEKAREEWGRQISTFKKIVLANEGINYDDTKLAALWDSEVRRLGNDPKNYDKESLWFLSEAHKNVKKMILKKKKS
jgi:hypothetical protein